jgi:hypothetical protein
MLTGIYDLQKPSGTIFQLYPEKFFNKNKTMKKIILPLTLAVLFLTITILSFAQVKYRFAAGGNISALKGDAVKSLNNVFDLTKGVADQQSNFGFTVRASAELPVNEMFSIEPGLSFSQKGYVLKGDFTSGFLKLLNTKANLDVNSNYIGLDALVKINPAAGFSIKFGPQINYLVTSNVKITSSVFGFSLLNESIDLTGEMKRVDAGLTGGLEYEFGNGITVSGYYTHGLSAVDKNSNFKAYNRSAGFTLGYKF